MNTDAILDFVVENYIWFIIGGVVILLAVIGFIAEKKKIIPKKKEKEERFKENKDETVNPSISGSIVEGVKFNSEPETLDMTNPETSTEPEELEITPGLEGAPAFDVLPAEELIQENNEPEMFEMTANLKPFESEENEEKKVNIDSDVNIFNAKPNLISEETIEPEEIHFEEPITESENLETEDAKTQEVLTENLDVNEKTEENSSLKEESPRSNSFNSFNFSTVDDDINRINDMNFSDKDDEKLEDTMQISYSQLKEIVQDIISENETDKNEKEVVETNEDAAQDIASLENTKNDENKNDLNVSSINDANTQKPAPQDDEDDVWKF